VQRVPDQHEKANCNDVDSHKTQHDYKVSAQQPEDENPSQYSQNHDCKFSTDESGALLDG